MIIIAKFTGMIARAGLWVAGTGLVLMTALIAAQVDWRFMLNDSLIWTEPASVMIMGWFIFLGAAVGIREGYHLPFDVMLYVVQHRGKMFLHSVSDAVVTVFGMGMVWFGWKLAAQEVNNTLPSLGISGAFNYAPLIVGGVLIVLFSLERLARRAVGLPTARFGEVEQET